MAQKSHIEAALRSVQEPRLNHDIVSLKMVDNIQVEGDTVSFTLIPTTPSYPFENQVSQAATAAITSQVSDIKHVKISWGGRVPADLQLMSKLESGVRNAIAVAAGKGGVGKSTIATNLALSLALDGAAVGLLDADVYGPNIPMMMGVTARPKAVNQKMVPPVGHGVKLISMGFLVDDKQPLIWRGPMLHSAVRQFIQDVDWGGLDYLIIDMPPGTGDVSLSLSQSLGLSGAVIVTTPQQVAISDVIRSVGMFEQLNVPVMGVIENMSYFVAPDTGKRYDIFGHGGGKAMAAEVNVPFLGEIPLEPAIRQGGDEGTPIVVRDPEAPSALAIREVAQNVAAHLSQQNLAQKGSQFAADPNLSIIR